MQLIRDSEIIINPDRQRKEFEPVALGELSEAIRLKGLMHAIVLRDTEAGLTLVAGERRLRAVEQLWMLGGVLKYNGQPVPEGMVPYVTLGQLTPLEAEEAELEENLHRKDLTWQEQSAAMGRLHALRTKQAQAAGRIHTVADTAMETKGRADGSYQDSVRKELIVARHLDNPEVQRAKSTEEAFKILRKQEETKKHNDNAASIGKIFNSSIHELHNANCLEWMANCDPEQFDVILTDPPYGMGADTFSDGGSGRLTNNEHHYDDSYESWVALMTPWCKLAFRVAKPQAHAYVFCDIANFFELGRMMKAAGWYVFRTPFICCKPNSGRVPLPTMGPRRQYETLLYAIKGNRNTTSIYSDVLTSTADANLTHGAQKPVALYENLLQRSVRAGDVVLDCFAGSGTIFPASHAFKCKAVGIEMNPEYFSISLKRMQELDKAIADQVVGDSLGNELQGLLGKKP